MKRFARFVPALVLLVATLLAYSNSFNGGFVLDNKGLILNDPRLREVSGSNIALIFGHTYWWPNGESGLYRPFTTLSYLFNYSVLGNADNPGGYHAVNFLLHCANAVLIYLLASRLLRERWQAFFVALLWAVHPINTECVTNIVGRADLLAALGVLGGLLAYLHGQHRMRWLWATALCSGFAAFSKEVGVVLPAVIVLCDLTFRRERAGIAPRLIGAAAALVPVAIMLLARHEVLSGTAPMEIPFTDNPIAWVGFIQGRMTALTVVGRYLGLILWPMNLSVDYSWSQIPLAEGVWGLAILLMIPLLVLMYRWNRGVFFLFCLGLVWLAPASNLLFPTGTIMAERLLYLVSVGVIACVVLGVRYFDPRTGTALLCLLTIALATRTWARNRDWKDELSIASASVASSPNSFKTHDLLANVLFASDPSHANIGRVIEESERSLAILNRLPEERRPKDPYRFAANCYRIRGDTARAGSLDPMNPEVYRQRAESAASSGRFDDAAIALVEGSFITSDKSLRQALIELYSGAMKPGSCVLISGPGGPAINPNCGVVHSHVCAASVAVVKTLSSARQMNVAYARKKMFAEQFRCPKQSLDEVLP